jgi:hypothetical protein
VQLSCFFFKKRVGYTKKKKELVYDEFLVDGVCIFSAVVVSEATG